MEIQKEGLQVYSCRECPENPYFLHTEYQVLRCNQLKGLLVLQLRERNGEKALLYDITGYKNLIEIAAEGSFSLRQCRALIQSLSEVLSELEEYMLDAECLCCEPETIYSAGQNEYRWMYYPGTSVSSDTRVEQLFQWLLSRIDYGDMDTVQFMYHAFWRVRSHTFSPEILMECLRYTRKPLEEYRSESYEEYFPQQEMPYDIDKRETIPYPAVEQERKKEDREKDNGEKWRKILFVLMVGVLSVCVMFCIFLLVRGLQQGYSSWGLRCQVGVIILIGVLVDLCYHLTHRRKKRERELSLEEGQESLWPSGDFFQETGKTEVLGRNKEEAQPALKDIETGKVYRIYACPFYIGNEKGLNQLSMTESTISRQHAMIMYDGGQWEIQDLHSTNGTWVNHKALPPEKSVILQSGDEIQFAEKCFQFFLLEQLPE